MCWSMQLHSLSFPHSLSFETITMAMRWNAVVKQDVQHIIFQNELRYLSLCKQCKQMLLSNIFFHTNKFRGLFSSLSSHTHAMYNFSSTLNKIWPAAIFVVFHSVVDFVLILFLFSFSLFCCFRYNFPVCCSRERETCVFHSRILSGSERLYSFYFIIETMFVYCLALYVWFVTAKHVKNRKVKGNWTRKKKKRRKI